MAKRFEELDWAQTSIGEISLRRRRDPVVDVDVYEVKLGDEFLMSSLFTVVEEELARLGLAAAAGDDLTVVVGGLGLGFTACAALADRRVARLDVIELVEPVIDWHRRGLIPATAGLVNDPRVTLRQADFFELVRTGQCPTADVLLVDIDHSPANLLHPGHQDLYGPDGLERVRAALRPGGVFALWSDDPVDAEFEAALVGVFGQATSHVVTFANPLTRGTSANTVYVAETRTSSGGETGQGRLDTGHTGP